MNPSVTILTAVLLPLAAAPVVSLLSRRPNLREGVTLTAGAALLLSIGSLVPSVLAGSRPVIRLVEMLPGLTLTLQVEPLGMLFALIAAGLWIITSIYAIGYMRGHHEENQTRFFFFFSVAITAAIGVAFSANMLTLFVFYEALTLSTYPLVTHHRSPEARRGGRIYLGILLSTSVVFLLFALLWTWQLTGTLDFRSGGILAGKIDGFSLCILLALYAFGTGKAALMPFHSWLPAAMVAPTPVSALLHAVAVVKAGVFTIMKVTVYIFGLDLLTVSGASVWLVYASGMTIVLASLIALTKDNLKARLAYSTVSQLAYIVMGAALAHDYGKIGGSLHIVTHAFGKITLFFCAGSILLSTHKTEISDMKGIGRKMPLTMIAFFIGSLSVIGIPPLGGFWSKWYLVQAAMETSQYFAICVLMISSLLTIAYLLPVVINAFFYPVPVEENKSIHEAPRACTGPLLFTAAGTFALFLYPDPLLALIRLIGVL